MIKPTLQLNPFLHFRDSEIYNPLTDLRVSEADPNFAILKNLRGAAAIENIEIAQPDQHALLALGWLTSTPRDLANSYLLKYVSIETHTMCNHKCTFCPVSVHTREREFMPKALFANITQQLAEQYTGIEGVFLNGYNEPSIDPNFVEYVRVLQQLGLKVAVNSNGSGLNPSTVDSLLSGGPLEYLCINLSSLDPIKFNQDRQAQHLNVIIRNLDYIADKPLAKQLRIVVLGEDDAAHDTAFAEITARYAGSNFEVIRFRVDWRSGRINVLQQVDTPHRKLAGCEQTGSRPLQHLHINASGQCVLCCQDYYEQYVVGDLNTQTIEEVMSGSQMAQFRRWAYGIEEAPDDFICRKCTFALTA